MSGVGGGRKMGTVEAPQRWNQWPLDDRCIWELKRSNGNTLILTIIIAIKYRREETTDFKNCSRCAMGCVNISAHSLSFSLQLSWGLEL